MNLTVQTPAELLQGTEKPAIISVESLSLQPDDCLVLCGGFEDRALATLTTAISDSERFKVFLIEYEPYILENKGDAIKTMCFDHGFHLTLCIYNRLLPAGFGHTAMQLLGDYKGRIYIDVSAMSRILIVQVLAALGTVPGMYDRCTLLYTEAKDYPPSEQEALKNLTRSADDPNFSILFLSSGVFEITILPELSSIAVSGSQSRLIAFPSLDAHHLTALRVELQPSRFSFIEGVPPHPGNQWRKGVIAAINHLSEYQNAETFWASTLDYRETLECLLRIYAKHSLRDRILISPTGSKMQSVAVGIFRAFVQDVQVVYPTPQGFCSPECYTKGIGPMYRLDLDELGGEGFASAFGENLDRKRGLG